MLRGGLILHIISFFGCESNSKLVVNANPVVT
jgi:hypothetical protein